MTSGWPAPNQRNAEHNETPEPRDWTHATQADHHRKRPSKMAKTSVSAARIVALGIAAKGDLETAVRTLEDSRTALQRWAEELTIEPENAHQSAVGVQAEAIRIAMSGLTVRAASERLSLVATLAKDAAGGAT